MVHAGPENQTNETKSHVSFPRKVASAVGGAVLAKRQLQPDQCGKVYLKAAVSIGTMIALFSVRQGQTPW